MKKLECYIRPHKLDEVKIALAEIGIQGLTVMETRGTGSSSEPRDSYGGVDYVISLPIKIKLEMIVRDEQAEEVIETVMKHAQTGRSGDGKIFITNINDAMRIRTAETGESVL